MCGGGKMLLLLLCLLIPLQIGSSGPVEKADYFLFDATQALSPIHCTQTDLQAACFQGMFLLPTYLAHPWTEHFSNTLQEKKKLSSFSFVHHCGSVSGLCCTNSEGKLFVPSSSRQQLWGSLLPYSAGCVNTGKK